ncbi:Guanine nucleotide exchange factor lte1 [Collariella sp. IMI 366227]|nr:Guanine nucleotide exchange factor lte1 [Collariella sp. IMI 366227]
MGLRKFANEAAENFAGRRARKASQDEDITPDEGSAGREGRQFAVANVGNNGRIYLRPTVRPANQRYPQPNFVFPMTPPSTAGLTGAAASDERPGLDAVMQLRLPPRDWTPSHPPSSSPSLGHHNSGEKQIKIRQRHRRAMSDSTVPDTSIARESEPGGFKVVITKPTDERPRTVEAMDPNRPPLLEVAIPSWRIGSPRFSTRGTPFIRGSSYAPTEEMRSRSPSFFRLTPQDPPSGASRKFSFFRGSAVLASARSSNPLSPRVSRRLRATYMSTHLVIDPSMFDALTFKPACDDRTLVRYSTSGAVTAASPPRLVAEITSPSFVDYELLSDFFLTYRSFLEPSDLLRMLFARLRWALRRDDEVGQVVRVRTFVAMRHWILNYFMDDFLIDYDLRVTFCTLINENVDDLTQDLKARKVPHKILGELKKCWRRVCAQFWDGPEFDASLGAEVPAAPGGIAGCRDSMLVDPTFLMNTDADAPQVGEAVMTARGHTSFYAGMAQAGHIDAVVAGDRPGTPEHEVEGMDRNGAISPISLASIDVVSCSFPTKNFKTAQPGNSYKMAHPVDPSAMHNAEPVATTPRALVSKHSRPQGAHKRNRSLSDSLRDHATTTEKGLYKTAEFLLALPYAGSLVRGNFLPPSQALVEVHSPTPSARQTTLFHPPPVELSKEGLVASAMSGQGMKRLLGSVRRALSTKGQQVSPTHGTFINISPIGPRGATTNRLPGTPIVPQARYVRPGRPPVRIDLLGAEVAEDFKRAVREDSEAQSEKPGSSGTHDASPFGLSRDSHIVRPISDMGITTGSKSIVIVDDTSIPEDWPIMSGALPAVNSSVEAFAEAFAPHGADPTPPNTPPDRPIDTPRRPGGDLRAAVANVDDDLELDNDYDDDNNSMGGAGVKLSLFSTHSSQPVLRPSFEVEAQKLALIPDDVDDDGGERVLQNGEGSVGMEFEEIQGVEEVDYFLAMGMTREEKREHREVAVAEESGVVAPAPPGSSPATSTMTAQASGFLDVAGRHSADHSFLSDDSRASYSSIPLLERGLTDEGRSPKTVTKEWTDRSFLQGPDEDLTPLEEKSVHDSAHPSYDFVRKTESMERIQHGATVPTTDPTRGSLEQSFLDVDSDNESELSSELSSEILERESGEPSPSQTGLAISTLPAHPLAEPLETPPEPPITLLEALRMSPETAYIPTLQDHQVWEKSLPPTPETTPSSAEAGPFGLSHVSSPSDPTGTKEALRYAPKLSIPDPMAILPQHHHHQNHHHSKYSVHLPFILAFDSDILAQQFTLVEKDALNEIDWKELIDMRWKNAGDPNSCSGVATKDVRSWVSFLRDTDARGVEVVIARFNIMVKWAVSEIVLTRDIEERARCLVKFVHVAAHCRRYRNFATMSQLTIALTSNEISRLTRTWALVPEVDKKTLRDLEALMSPTRNFWSMRAEMEGGG